MKLATDSENVIVTVNVDEVTGLEALVAIATVGPVPSYVQAKVLEAVFALPAVSVKAPEATAIVVAPSPLGANVAV